MHLKIISGPAKGREIPLTVGKTVSVGRSSSKAMISFPDDEHLSGQHFTVGLRNGRVFLCNLSKTNPTEIDGQQVQSAVLKSGESFKAGINLFCVMSAESPHEAALRFGGWGFKTIPDGWEQNEEKGLLHCESHPFRANLIAAEEALPKDHDLSKYVQLQMDLGKKHLKEANFGEAKPAKVNGADSAVALTIHARAPQGPALQYQIYAVHEGVVGIITVTALECQGQLLRALLTQILPDLSFFQG